MDIVSKDVQFSWQQHEVTFYKRSLILISFLASLRSYHWTTVWKMLAYGDVQQSHKMKLLYAMKFPKKINQNSD